MDGTITILTATAAALILIGALAAGIASIRARRTRRPKPVPRGHDHQFRFGVVVRPENLRVVVHCAACSDSWSGFLDHDTPFVPKQSRRLS